MTPLQRAASTLKTQSRSLDGAPAGAASDQSEAESGKEGILPSVIVKLFGAKTQRQVKFSALDESAKKAAPKLFFAGERTFLQWMHTGILLAGISMALGSHAETGSVVDWISVLLLPVAIGIIIYAMLQCKSRPLVRLTPFCNA